MTVYGELIERKLTVMASPAERMDVSAPTRLSLTAMASAPAYQSPLTRIWRSRSVMRPSSGPSPLRLPP